MNAVLFDYTALLALGAGHRELSARIVAAHGSINSYIYAPALCLAAAVAERPALGEHVGQLPAIDIVELDYSAACSIGNLIAEGADWRIAHAIDTARPSADWPNGRPVITATPGVYTVWQISTIQLN